MNSEDVIDLFKKTGALLDGHFILTSGAHSKQYFQCARVLQYPQYAALLCENIAEYFRTEKIAVVAAPAVGGILVAHEVARALNARCIFAEREEAQMNFRRGFEIMEGERVLVVEDVITTGGSVLEVVRLCKSMNADVKGVGFIVDRSNGSIKFPVPQFSLLELEVEKYSPDWCPLCADGKIPPVKPGSRYLKSH
jgi:orotate phosphoribosyltransferase